jgi:hypothetical protein
MDCEFGLDFWEKMWIGTDLAEEFKALMSGAFSICNG